MKRHFTLGLLLVAYCGAAIIDRIAVSVGTRVITTNDLDREIKVTAFLNGVKPDFSPAAKRATVDRMVEQKLVLQELETSRYPMPETEQLEPTLAEFKQRFYPNEEDYRRTLTEYGITDADVRQELKWQRTLLEFVEVRFRPGVQVSDQDIQQYFENVVAPAARSAHPGQPLSLDDFRGRIEETLTGQREDREMDNWLTEVRKRIEIVYHDEALQ